MPLDDKTIYQLATLAAHRIQEEQDYLACDEGVEPQTFDLEASRNIIARFLKAAVMNDLNPYSTALSQWQERTIVEFPVGGEWEKQ